MIIQGISDQTKKPDYKHTILERLIKWLKALKR